MLGSPRHSDLSPQSELRLEALMAGKVCVAVTWAYVSRVANIGGEVEGNGIERRRPRILLSAAINEFSVIGG